MESLSGEPHTRLRYFCSPQHTDSAFYPIIGQMERAAGLTHDDTPHSRLDKLDAVLAQTSTSTQDPALVLLIVTFRPEFDPPWVGLPHVTAVTINRLTQRQVGAMIDEYRRVVPASPFASDWSAA